VHLQQAVDGESGTDRQDDIGGRGKQVAVQTEDLSDQPFDPVAPHRVAGFSLHTDPQPIVLKGICQKDQSKSITSKPLSGSIDALKLPGRAQEMIFRKRGTIQTVQAANCLRPFALLLLMTAWPVRVFIRTRKPWVRARLMVLG